MTSLKWEELPADLLLLQVVHHVHLKPERLTKRSSPDDLRLKIKVIYDYSVDRSVPQELKGSREVLMVLMALKVLVVLIVLMVLMVLMDLTVLAPCRPEEAGEGEAVPSGHRLPPAGAERAAPVGSGAAQQVRLQLPEFLDLAYLRKRDDPHRYCQDACADVTRCGPVVVPQHHLQQCKVCGESGTSCGPLGAPDGPGVEGADFVLYVSGVTTERCGQENIVAYAAYCQLEAELDRPIAGYANLCPSMISSQPQELEGMLSTVKHEIIHALEEARRHFNCPILEGMELENQGGTGTELNHWEKRLLENEAMTGSHTQNRVFSRLTLALLEDSGWYRADYSRAQRLDWGRGLGCDFVMKSCKFWMDRQRQRRHPVTPYCDTLRASPLQLTCRQDQLAVAVCNLQKHQQELPLEYQYFEAIPDVSPDQLPMFGGAVEIADFCPFSQEFSWHLSGEYQRNSHCRATENQPDWWRNYGAERYGPGSVCVSQQSAFVMEQCSRKVRCSARGLAVLVQDRSYPCAREGQPLSVSVRLNDWVYNGVLLCPACPAFCDHCPLPHQLPPGNASRSNPIGQLAYC
ncbi:Leishmanolysin-like peptidase [Liparis tanakae]|uniref:Leishmanolysin-like peptidase n=1 Tax=Liparis tanakae TaxID=230148 RepID=A0A4Z2HVF7_9TELE|nr:Leishmanolysin-like peptidase [Liparis tanakae]